MSRISSLRIPTYVLKSSSPCRFQLIVVLKNQPQRPFDKRSQADCDEDSTASSPAGEISSDRCRRATFIGARWRFHIKRRKKNGSEAFSQRKRRFEWLWHEFNIRLRCSAALHGGSDGPQASPPAPVGILEVLLSGRKGKNPIRFVCVRRTSQSALKVFLFE